MIQAKSEKKSRGRWGESVVDDYMHRVGYETHLANKIIRGGEIDRVYVRRFAHSQREVRAVFCFSEVKTRSVSSVLDLARYTEHAHVSRLVRRRQMKNLQRYGEHVCAQASKKMLSVTLYARLFLVVRIVSGDGLRDFLLEGFPGKVCARCAGYWILSLAPDLGSYE